MKLLKKLSLFLVIAFVLTLVFCSCSGKANSLPSGRAEYSYVEDSNYNKEYEVQPSSSESFVDENQMLIKKYTMYMETKAFDETIAKLKSLIDEYGYVSNSSIRNSTSKYSVRSATFTYRVASDKVDRFVDELGKLGVVTSSNLSTEDVAKQYYNLQAQMDSLLEEKSNFEKLRAGANYDALIKIEDKIAQLTTQINYLNSQIEYYKSAVSYSFVYLTVNEVEEYVVQEKTFWDQLADTFKDSLRVFGDFLHGALNVLIYLLPFTIISGVVAVIIVVSIKKSKKKKKKNEEKKAEETDNKQN